MHLTKQILTLKDIAKEDNIYLVYAGVKLTKNILTVIYQQGDEVGEYTINVKNYLKGSECKIAEIGYLTYPSEIECDFTTGINNLWESYCSYNVSGVSNFTIPVFLYVQNNRFGLAYSNGTILNIFGKTVQKVIDNLNTMCNNNPNFKLHLNEKFTNLINKD